MRATRLASIIIAVLSVSATEAVADSATQANVQFKMGVAKYKKGDLRGALADFFDSYATSRNPNVAFNIATCLENLRLFDDAFSAWTEYLALDLSDAERKAGQAALDRVIPKVARLVVTSTPAGATIYLDDRNLGARGNTPRAFAAKPGRHDVLATLDGHHGAERAAQLELGQERSIHFVLKKRTGQARVETTPAGAEIRLGSIDGAVRTHTPAVVELEIGSHRIYLTRPDYSAATELVRVRADEETVMQVELTPKPPTRARLRVSSKPSGALVLIDGAEEAASTAFLQPIVGRRRVEVRQPGYRPWSESVDIRPGDNLAADVILAPVDQATGRGPWPWVLLSTTVATALAGGVATGFAFDAQSRYRDNPTETALDRTRTLNTMSDVLVITTLIGGAATGALFVFTEDTPERQSEGKVISR